MLEYRKKEDEKLDWNGIVTTSTMMETNNTLTAIYIDDDTYARYCSVQFSSIFIPVFLLFFFQQEVE